MTDNLLDPPGTTEPSVYLTELVGEGKKFSDPEALAKGKWQSDSYIKVLEQRLDESIADQKKLREASSTQANMQELLDQFKQLKTAQGEITPQPGVTEKPIDSKQIESLVHSKIQEHEVSKREEENFNLVKSKIKEKYGDNVPASIKQQLETLGPLGNDLAKKHPNELLRVLGVEEQVARENFQSPPRSNLRSDNFKPKGATQKTWSYYQEMKKANPNLYYDKKTAVEMHNNAIALGDAFNDGDFGLTDTELLRTRF